MYLGFCFHNFVLFIILLSIFSFWEKLLENCFLLAAIFHMEHNINFVFHSCNLCQDGNSLYIILFITSLNCRDSSLLEAKLCMCAQSLSCVWLFVTPGTVARQASLSIGLSWQEYWSGLPFSPPEDLPNQGTESASPATPALEDGFFTTQPPGKPNNHKVNCVKETSVLWIWQADKNYKIS